MAPTLNGFQGIKSCVQYLDSHHHKPIFYPYNYYYGSNVIRLTWSGHQVEDHTTQNCLELHQYAYHDRIITRRQSVSDIIHTILGASVFYKVHMRPDIASESTDGLFIYMYKDFKKTEIIRRYMEALALHTG